MSCNLDSQVPEAFPHLWIMLCVSMLIDIVVQYSLQQLQIHSFALDDKPIVGLAALLQGMEVA
jgi:hypothetical protein